MLKLKPKILEQESIIKILIGDCREVLRTLPDESVHCVITSPPYYGLRDYKTASWVGGSPDCNHIEKVVPNSGFLRTGQHSTQKEYGSFTYLAKTICSKCGAKRIDRQIGLEETPEQYVQNLVEVFREVRRVLRKDGTVWLNLGDSYAAGRGGTEMPAETIAGGKMGIGNKKSHRGRLQIKGLSQTPNRKNPNAPIVKFQPHWNAQGIGLKHKDLIGIPWRVAFALQADGWWLRSDIIWSKNNPVPESVKDRCTKSHEYVFLLSKAPNYFYDQVAIAEPAKWGYDQTQNCLFGNQDKGFRNKRSVWNVDVRPPSEKGHFATFPEELITPMIKAGTSKRGCCAKCGASLRSRKEIEVVTNTAAKDSSNKAAKRRIKASGNVLSEGTKSSTLTQPRPIKKIIWEPTCKCDTTFIPCTILDPFAGTGTVGAVASKLGRSAILIELNKDFIEMSKRRSNATPLFTKVI